MSYCTIYFILQYFNFSKIMLNWIFQKNEVNSQGQYNFHVETQPKSIETSSNIMITCYANKNKNSVIPCKFNWFKIKNGMTTAINNIKGSSYLCQPSDAGSIIKAQITSLDEEYQGKAIFEFGPIRIDPLLKQNIQNMVSSDLGSFNVYLIYKNREIECILRINDGAIKIQDIQKETNLRFDYTLADPRIELHSKDYTKLFIRFSQKHEEDLIKFLSNVAVEESLTQSKKLKIDNKIEIKFPNRALRDTFLFVHKCFITKRELKTSVILNKIQNSSIVSDQNFNYTLEIQSIKSDLLNLLEINKQQFKEKQFYRSEVKRLQQELETIILTYTKIVEDKYKNQIDFNQSYSVLTNKRQQIFSKKQRNLQVQNKELEKRIRILVQENQQLKKLDNSNNSAKNQRTSQGPFAKKTAPFEEMEGKIQELSKINNRLVQENSKLKIENQVYEKQRSVENILEQLNTSNQKEIIIQKLNESVSNLKKQKQIISKQLEVSVRKNQELSRVVSNTNLNNSKMNISHRIQNISNINPIANNQHQIHQLIQQLNELKKQNQILFNDNKILHNLRNEQHQNVNLLRNQNIKFKQQIQKLLRIINSLNSQNSNKNNQTNNQQNIVLAKKVDDLQLQNNQLKNKIKNLERENSELKSHILEFQHLSKGLQEKQNKIFQLQQTIKQLTSSKDDKDSQEGVTKYKKKIQELLEEIKFLKKNNDVMNRSRDLSMEMDSYYQEENQLIKQQNEMLTQQNEKLTKMCQRYLKEAKESTKLRAEIIQLRKQNQQLRKQLQNRSYLNHEAQNQSKNNMILENQI